MNTNCFQNGIQGRVRSIIDSLGVSDAEFARSIGYSRANLSQALKGKRSMPEAKLTEISRVYNIRYNWLLTGEGAMREEDEKPQISMTQGVPYFNVDFTLGFDLLENDQTRNPDYLIDFPLYNRCTCWVNAHGDSMSPTISSGDMVALKQLEDFRYLISGEIYAIVTKNGLRTIKRVNDKGNDIELIPDNKDYSEQLIPKEELIAVFSVKACVKAY
jgi:phage repressor protein C with HTH and peptisase S24 domain